MIGEGELSPIYQGKGTLFANFQTRAVTGCFVFRPMVTNMAFLLLVQVKRFLAAANKTHLSIITGCFIFFPGNCDQTLFSVSWLALHNHVVVVLGGRGTDKSQSFLVKVKVSTQLHQNWQNVAVRRQQFIIKKDKRVILASLNKCWCFYIWNWMICFCLLKLKKKLRVD